MHSPFVEMIRTVVRRGVESGDFRVGRSGAAVYFDRRICFFYLSNSASAERRDLRPRSHQKEARDERLAHMVALVLARPPDRKIDR